MRKYLKKYIAGIIAIAMMVTTAGIWFVSAASAEVTMTVTPTSLVSGPLTLPANSVPTALFSFSLGSNGGETLSSVVVQVNGSTSSNVTANHIASLSIYADNGSGIFNPSSDQLIGTQTNLNLNIPSAIYVTSATPASGKFYIAMTTGSAWTNTGVSDSVYVILPSNAINASSNSPIISQISTGDISAEALLTPSITTAIHDSSENAISNANTGAIVHDTVNISGSAVTPTGSATLSFFNNSTCVAPAASTSDSLALTNGAIDATSFAKGPLSAGTYSFNANYSGDNVYAAGVSACTPITITTDGTVNITTQLSATATNTNTTVTDSAVLGNVTSSASGTVTYNSYFGTVCTGTPVFTNSENAVNGIVGISGGFTPTTPGTYYWQAVYSGDANNSSATSSCGNEILVVNSQIPSPQVCADGMINGRVYKMVGSQQYYLAANCNLQLSTTESNGQEIRNCHTIIGFNSLSQFRDPETKVSTTNSNVQNVVKPIVNMPMQKTYNKVTIKTQSKSKSR